MLNLDKHIHVAWKNKYKLKIMFIQGLKEDIIFKVNKGENYADFAHRIHEYIKHEQVNFSIIIGGNHEN